VGETLETANEIKTIRFKIEAIESTQQLLLRERAEQLREEILGIFASTRYLAEVYLAVDGNRSQGDIVDYLKSAGLEISQPTVSRRMGKLDEEGLIEKAGVGQRGVVWRRKQLVEKVLKLSRHLTATSG
jgi:DNA-binding transcriptional ArsR family regulator